MKSAVIGLGETGRSLFEILSEYHEVDGIDLKDYKNPIPINYDVINICIPYSDGFIQTVQDYQDLFNQPLTIIHSTVPIGTTSKIKNAVHSPILGKHDNMKSDLKAYRKWVGGEKAEEVRDYLQGAGFYCHCVPTSEETEALKLLCLAKYGMSIAFAQYCKDIADKYDFSYEDVAKWDINYNNAVAPHLKRPVLFAPNGGLGGHCISQNVEYLYAQSKEMFGDYNGILKAILDLGVPKTYDQKCKSEWTQQEDEKLTRLSPHLTLKEIAKLLPNRSYDAVRTRAIKLNIASSYDPSKQDYATRRKISASLMGISEDEWNGFKETTNALIRKSIPYQKWRESVFKRDDYTCQKCGARCGNGKAVYLEAHHIQPFSEFEDLRMDADNGITLCQECHRTGNGHIKKEEILKYE